jgi:hypothetical protein
MLDQSVSLEKILKHDPRFSPMVQKMNTKNLEIIFPELFKEYGMKKFDIMFSLSHNLIKS